MLHPLKLEDDHRCFACGMENPDGLRILWTTVGTVMTGQFTPPSKYQGWKGILHGGIIATLLDEAMTRLVCIACGDALSAEMTVRFVRPAHIGEPLDIRGEITGEKGKLIYMKASIHAQGIMIARATGKAIKICPRNPLFL